MGDVEVLMRRVNGFGKKLEGALPREQAGPDEREAGGIEAACRATWKCWLLGETKV
jgi:hypothetical protein